MKLITYLDRGAERVGVLTADGSAVRPLDFPDMLSLIEASAEQRQAAVEAAGEAVPLSSVTLLAPIPRPRQDVICLGINYQEHAVESARFHKDAFVKEEEAIYFSKRVSEAGAPGGYIESSGLVTQLDYEAELAVIIGKRAKNVPADKAADYIFGYTVLNDVTDRAVQTAHKQWYFGKSLDTFTPMGPCITTADEIPFPPALAISSRVNGEPRQASVTDRLITGIAEIIQELSFGMTLLPGTVIATGTPSGVGMGFTPPKFLKPGDVVECEIEGIGVLKSTVR